MQINFKFCYKKERKKIYNDLYTFHFIFIIYHSDFFITIKDILYIYRILSFCGLHYKITNYKFANKYQIGKKRNIKL